MTTSRRDFIKRAAIGIGGMTVPLVVSGSLSETDNSWGKSGLDLPASSEVGFSNEFRFICGDKPVLRLTQEGFVYMDKTITDAGKAYRLFMAWMDRSAIESMYRKKR